MICLAIVCTVAVLIGFFANLHQELQRLERKRRRGLMMRALNTYNAERN